MLQLTTDSHLRRRSFSRNTPNSKSSFFQTTDGWLNRKRWNPNAVPDASGSRCFLWKNTTITWLSLQIYMTKMNKKTRAKHPQNPSLHKTPTGWKRMRQVFCKKHEINLQEKGSGKPQSITEGQNRVVSNNFNSWNRLKTYRSNWVFTNAFLRDWIHLDVEQEDCFAVSLKTKDKSTRCNTIAFERIT